MLCKNEIDVPQYIVKFNKICLIIFSNVVLIF